MTKLPDNIFGIDTKEAYRKYQAQPDKKKEEPKPRTVTTSIDGVNLSDYVYLANHNLYVAKQRTLQNHNWENAHKELHKQKARMLTIREFVDFLNLLKSGNAQDGLQNKIKKEDLQVIYKDIVEVRDPYRAEWLDAAYRNVQDKWFMDYNHRTVNGTLTPQNQESLEACLREDKTPGISLENWLSNPTKQGLPKANVGKGSLYYWHPKDKRVSWFGANSDGAGLICGEDPAVSDDRLGVRAAREKT